MAAVGQLFEDGKFFVPAMLIAARAMSAALQILKPRLVEQGVEPIGKIAIGTVKGDLHDIGQSLVAMMLEGAGFEIVVQSRDGFDHIRCQILASFIDHSSSSRSNSTSVKSSRADRNKSSSPISN